MIPRSAILQTAQGVAVMAGRAGAPELSPMVYGAGQWIYAYQGHEVCTLLHNAALSHGA